MSDFLLLQGGTDHLLIEGTSDALLLQETIVPVTGTMAGTFGSLTATMLGSVVPTIEGTMVAAFGSLNGLISESPDVPIAWRAKLVPSSWSAYLKR